MSSSKGADGGPGNGADGAGLDGRPSTGDSSVGSDGGSSTGGPTILNLSSNVTTLTPSGQLIVTAVVTDPQGIAQVVGGTLGDPSGATYGAFEVSTTSGAYSLTLTWNAIDMVQAINSGAGGTPRTFEATFYDQAGRQTSKTFVIQLQCDTPTDGICGGVCTDLQTDVGNCGKCEPCTMVFPMTDSALLSCVTGKCQGLVQGNTDESCDALCMASGFVCVSGTNTCDAFYASQPTSQEGDNVKLAGCDVVPQSVDPNDGMTAFQILECQCSQ